MVFLEYDLSACPPGRATLPYVTGGAVEGGRAMSGLVNAVNMNGGGLVAVKYTAVQLGNNLDPQVGLYNLRYWSRLAAILNNGVRSILVPLLVDGISPRQLAAGGSGLATFSDGSSFSDTSRMSQDAVPSTIGVNAARGAATVTLVLQGGTLFGGEWFSVDYADGTSRAHCVSDVDSIATDSNQISTIVCGIVPPLRQAVTLGMRVNFGRPRCLMRLAPGTTVSAEVEQFWWSTPDISFIESFGTI